ncbi:MAG: hypothetical protein HUU21_36620 [Polyangiaceae bacterium]|nr:hypothetical protein [Polyangiaceae bacterium]
MAGLSACTVADEEPNLEEIAEHEQPFSSTQEPNHQEIMAEALGFLHPDILAALTAANLSADVQFALVSAYHFDDCNFSDSSKLVAAHQAAAVQALDPSQATAATDAAAVVAFGTSLHIVQDFYSHSNWVELGAQGLVDDSLDAFSTLNGYDVLDPSGVQIVEGSPPPGTAVYKAVGKPYPDNAIVHVVMNGTKRLGLFSGSVDYEPGDKCPLQIQMSHDDLNKDNSMNPGRAAQFIKAKSLAVQQTRHEWCRLLTLTRDAWGDAGTQRLSSWVADAAAAPQCD